MNMHIGAPDSAQDSLSEELAAQEAARLEAIKTITRLRKEASAEIDRLIAFMDETDGYTTSELEEAVDDVPCCDNELEKNLSGVGAHHIPDAEGDQFGDLEDDVDDEPSLGSVSIAAHDSQERWAAGDNNDCEGDPGFDDREDVSEDEGAQCEGGGDAESEDMEPNLGWTEAGVLGNTDDRENSGHAPIKRKRHKARGIGSERLFSGRKRLTNLPAKLRKSLDSRVDSSKVTV